MVWLSRIKLSESRCSLFFSVNRLALGKLADGLVGPTPSYAALHYTALPSLSRNYVAHIGLSVGWPSWSFPPKIRYAKPQRSNPFIESPMREQSKYRSFHRFFYGWSSSIDTSHFLAHNYSPRAHKR